MKKLLLILSFFVTATIFAATILRYSDHKALGNMRTKFLKEVLFNNIEKESKGRIKIKDHWNGELSSSYDALKNISQNDVADITVVVPEYVGTLWSHQLLFKSFPTGPSANEQVNLLRKLYRKIPQFNAEIEKTGVKNLMVATGYPVAFFSTKKMRSQRNPGPKMENSEFLASGFFVKIQRRTCQNSLERRNHKSIAKR